MRILLLIIAFVVLLANVACETEKEILKPDDTTGSSRLDGQSQEEDDQSDEEPLAELFRLFRIRYIQVFLGRELTLDELAVVNKHPIDDDISFLLAWPELEKAYNFLKSGGVASDINESMRTWDSFIETPNVRSKVKEYLGDFNSAWSSYNYFCKEALQRVIKQDNLTWETVGAPIGPDDIMPYTVWSFEDWLKVEDAWGIFWLNTLLSYETELTPLKQILSEHGVSSANLSIFDRPTGYSYAEQFQSIVDALGSDEDFADLISGFDFWAFTTSLNSAFLEKVTYEVMNAVTQTFLPRVMPKYREQFLEELQLALPNFFERFGQLYGHLLPSSNVIKDCENINIYQQDFIDWMRNINFFYYAGFASLQENQKEQGTPYIPTIELPPLIPYPR